MRECRGRGPKRLRVLIGVEREWFFLEWGWHLVTSINRKQKESIYRVFFFFDCEWRKLQAIRGKGNKVKCMRKFIMNCRWYMVHRPYILAFLFLFRRRKCLKWKGTLEYKQWILYWLQSEFLIVIRRLLVR